MVKRLLVFVSVAVGVGVSGLWVVRAQDQQSSSETIDLKVQHADCTLFGPQRDRFLQRQTNPSSRLGRMTAQVTGMLGAPMALAAAQPMDEATATMPSVPGGSRTFT